MINEYYKQIIYLIFCILLIVGALLIGLSIFETLPDRPQFVYEVCCNGSVCTDTYYNKELNKCVLVLCENNALIINKSACYYEPANIEALS